MQNLLELCTNELNHAQTLLSKADNVFHAQMLSIIKNLNTTSLRLAVLLTGNPAFSDSRPHQPKSRAVVEPVLGKNMTDILANGWPDEDPINVQTGLQAMNA